MTADFRSVTLSRFADIRLLHQIVPPLNFPGGEGLMSISINAN